MKTIKLISILACLLSFVSGCVVTECDHNYSYRYRSRYYDNLYHSNVYYITPHGVEHIRNRPPHHHHPHHYSPPPMHGHGFHSKPNYINGPGNRTSSPGRRKR